MQTQVIHSLITQKSFQCLSSDTCKIEEGVLLHLLWVNLTCFICSAIYTKKKNDFLSEIIFWLLSEETVSFPSHMQITLNNKQPCFQRWVHKLDLEKHCFNNLLLIYSFYLNFSLYFYFTLLYKVKTRLKSHSNSPPSLSRTTQIIQ